MQSHPMWVRGLKLLEIQKKERIMSVAPYVGAWIETRATAMRSLEPEAVAPYVGAWIETDSAVRCVPRCRRTLCGCVD